MVRTPSCDKSGLRKGTWTPEEDKKLIAYVTRYGSWNWRQLPRFAGLARCGKSCRLRWMNYLRPNLKRGNFNQEEEDIIIKLHTKLGNRWSAIAAQLPGRTDNEIKNHWHTTLKKRFQQNKAPNEEQPKSSTTTPENDHSVPNKNSQISDIIAAPFSPISSSSSSEFSSSITSSSDHSLTNGNLLIEDDDFSFLDGSFWTEPYLAEILSTTPTSDNNNNQECVDFGQSSQDTTTTTQMFDACASLVDLGENEFGSCSFMLDGNNHESQKTEQMIESFWTQPYVSYADVYHVPSEYFSPLCGADLWTTTTQNNTMYDEHLSLF